MNKALKTCFSLLYDKGNLTNLVITLDRIKELDDFYKKNFNNYTDFDIFEKNNIQQFEDLKKSASAYQEIKKQFCSKKGLQPCILTECFVAQTIANKLNLTNFIDLDDKSTKVPAELINTLFTAQMYVDGSSFRYCYYNNQFNTLVFQCGSSTTVDIIFTKSGESIRIEVKEDNSILEGVDITGLYDETGKLLIDERFKKKRENYIPYINLFNKITNVFKMEGHNFNFHLDLTDQSIKDIINETLGRKVIDMYIFVVNNKVVPALSNYLVDFVTFDGSEIRTAGKNSRKFFTPIYVKKKIEDLGGTITNNVVTLPYDIANKKKGRQLSYETRYTIGSLLFVYLDETTVQGNNISFRLDDVLQKVPNISVHLKCRINYDSLELQFSSIQ